MITLKQLKRLNVISWIPIVNFFVVNVYMWDKLRRHKVFTTKQVVLSNLRLLVYSTVYALLREWIFVSLYDLVPDQLFLLTAIAESWCVLIIPVRFAYYDIKKAYARQDNQEVIMIACPVCNYKQPANRAVCWKCGAEILREVDSKTEQIGNCDICGAEDVVIHYAKISSEYNTRTRYMCNNCVKKYNATIVLKISN